VYVWASQESEHENAKTESSGSGRSKSREDFQWQQESGTIADFREVEKVIYASPEPLLISFDKNYTKPLSQSGDALLANVGVVRIGRW
jgi:hypothetical protein